jgi:predicted nucleotidyltransferase
MAEVIAQKIPAREFGVCAIYLIGSTKNANAGFGSDLDLIIHIRNTEQQRLLLLQWLEGWSLALAEFNYLKTGYSSSGLLDVHLITDADIAQKSSFAVKIGAVTDAARLLRSYE